MRHKLRMLTLLALLFTGIGSSLQQSALAQSNADAFTRYAVTVYSAPDPASSITGIFIPHAKVIVEARNSDTSWVLGHNVDGSVRGWVQSRFLDFTSGFDLPNLQVSGETVFVPMRPYSPEMYRRIDLNAYPIIPASMGNARAIFERGRTRGADPHVVSKIGDCISDNQHFLSPFGWGDYNLGSYTLLQNVIDHFGVSLAVDSLAAYDGLVTSAVLDPVFANPMACRPGESPLRCELRVHNPSVAVIMFGAQDLLFTSPEDFDLNLRRIIHETVEAGVIPLLSTFPGNLDRWDQTIFYNQIVVQVALDYNIPLMNLWRGLEALPNHGLNSDGRHLSLPVTTSGDLTGVNLRRGYPLRNLVTLQALDVVWQSAMY